MSVTEELTIRFEISQILPKMSKLPLLKHDVSAFYSACIAHHLRNNSGSIPYLIRFNYDEAKSNEIDGCN